MLSRSTSRNFRSPWPATNRWDVNVQLRPERLYEILGENGESELSPRSRRWAGEAIELVNDVWRPRAVSRVLSVTQSDGEVLIGGFLPVRSRKISRVLEHCRKAVVFVVTLGAEIDEVIEEASSRRMYQGSILDRTASAGAEAAAESVAREVGRNLRPDEGLTQRYSPGYCDWSITEQAKLFELLPDSPVGVELNDGLQMTPRKSVSGVIGIGTREVVEKYGNACRWCGRHSCNFRRGDAS